MSSILQKQVAVTAGAITLVTTAETLIAYSGRVEATYATVRSIIKGWASVTWGTGTTQVTARMRRGNGITGALVGFVTESVTAANNTNVSLKLAEQLLNIEFADYSFTLAQAGATANGTVNAGSIEAEMING